MALRIDGGTVLLGGELVEAAVTLEHGRIGSVGDDAGGSRTLDARGLLVLPGIVDLHGDAFERQVQPRPGVEFAADLAVRDTEAQLLANGITTAFHAVTLSWEPGLRGPEAWRRLLDALAAWRGACDVRVNMRWELHNLDALEVALADIAAGQVHMVTFNDHTPAILRKLGTAEGAAKYPERAMMPLAAFRALAERAMAFTPDVPAAAARLAAAARAAGLPIASHDDDSVATRRHFRGLGATVCEFPMAEAVAVEACAAGEAVVMGCPNVVRGGSHLGWAAAGPLAERGLCSVLVSDYFYPAMAQSALRLAAGPLGLAGAWALISANPAAAAGLHDRGTIAPGLRADLVLVEPGSGAILATVAGGRVAHLTGSAWERLH
jgi:alpha-D-ribose 1-methylphosphonate 5-triphosphate diphosphatase